MWMLWLVQSRVNEELQSLVGLFLLYTVIAIPKVIFIPSLEVVRLSGGEVLTASQTPFFYIEAISVKRGNDTEVPVYFFHSYSDPSFFKQKLQQIFLWTPEVCWRRIFISRSSFTLCLYLSFAVERIVLDQCGGKRLGALPLQGHSHCPSYSRDRIAVSCGGAFRLRNCPRHSISETHRDGSTLNQIFFCSLKSASS